MRQAVDGLPDWIEGLQTIKVAAAFSSGIWQLQDFDTRDYGPVGKPEFFPIAHGKE